MELYFITRGIKKDVDEFVKWMETRILPMEVEVDKAGIKSKYTEYISSNLKPIQLWSLAFPKENLDAVLNTFNMPGKSPYGNADGSKMIYNINPKLWVLKKLLHADSIPIPDPSKGKIMLPNDLLKNINVLGIGLREDGEITEIEVKHERI